MADVDRSKGLAVVLVVSGQPWENITAPLLILYAMGSGWLTRVQGKKQTLIARVIKCMAPTSAYCGWDKIEELRTGQPHSLTGLDKTPSSHL